MNPTFEGIRLAIERRLASWDGVPVEYDGAPQTLELKTAITTKQSWVRCTIQHGDSFTAGIGSSPCVRRTGLIQFQVFTDRLKGSRPAALLADSLAAHFEYHQDGQFETQAASVKRIGDSDGWYMYRVSLPFRMG